MSFLGKLFGSEDVVSAGLSAGDKIFYTDEEKSDYKLMFLKAYEPFKLAQRMIVMTIIPAYTLAWVTAFIIRAFGGEISGLLELLRGDMGTTAIIIVTFYFGGGAAEGIIGRFQGKTKKK